MKLLVCVKQVIDPDMSLRIDESGRWMSTDYTPRFQMNRFDEFAVEEAVSIKENHADVRVEVLSVGPTRVLAAIERAVGMGADRGIRVAFEEQGFISPRRIAAWISAYAADRGYDIVLTGIMSEDCMQGMVGPMIAETLNRPWASSVISLRIELETGTLYVEREIERGRREELRMLPPAVLSLQTGINKPRYPSLSNLLRAKKQAVETVAADTLPDPVELENLVRIKKPVRRRDGVVLEGTTRDKAAGLAAILRERALI